MAARDVLVASPVTGTGGILAGPLGTAVPTDASATPHSNLEPRGYVGEDGLSMTTNRTTEKVRAWGGDTVRVVQSEHDVTFSWSYLETTELTAADVYGEDNVTSVSGLTSIKLNSDPLPHKTWVFEMKDGDRRVRVVVPDGQITEIGDTQFVHTAATAHEVTLEAFPDATGNKAYIYILDGAGPAPDAWAATTVYTIGKRVSLAGNEVLEAVSGGTSGSNEPVAPGIGSTVSDGTVEWLQVA